jgi:hypothetical protein
VTQLERERCCATPRVASRRSPAALKFDAAAFYLCADLCHSQIPQLQPLLTLDFSFRARNTPASPHPCLLHFTPHDMLHIIQISTAVSRMNKCTRDGVIGETNKCGGARGQNCARHLKGQSTKFAGSTRRSETRSGAKWFPLSGIAFGAPPNAPPLTHSPQVHPKCSHTFVRSPSRSTSAPQQTHSLIYFPSGLFIRCARAPSSGYKKLAASKCTET